MPINLNRRQFVEWSTHGLGSIALLELLQQDGVLAAAIARSSRGRWVMAQRLPLRFAWILSLQRMGMHGQPYQ